jgi:excisionase family DNA binding protein
MSLEKSKAPSLSNPDDSLPELLTTEDVCRILKVKESFVRDLRSQQRIPFRKIGHLVRYLPEEITAWIRNGDSANTKSPRVIKTLEVYPGGSDVHHNPKNPVENDVRRFLSGSER